MTKVDILKLDESWKTFSLKLNTNIFPRLLEIRLISSVQLNGSCKLKKEEHSIIFQAEYFANLKGSCENCLNETEIEIKDEFQISLLPVSYYKFYESNKCINNENTDIDFYSERYVEINKYLEDQLILELPNRLVCKSDCLGLCSQCGQNLNIKKCNCSLDKIKNKLVIIN